MHAIYIGQNKSWIDQFKVSLNGNLIITESPFKARSFIFEHFYNTQDNIFILIELGNAETTLKQVAQLKKNKTQNQYLLLVGESMPQTIQLSYINNGVDQIIAPSISKESLIHILNFLPRIRQHSETEESIRTFHLPLWKRSFDILFSSLALICLSPLLLITIMAIRLESRGPVIYISQRVGSNYRIFGFYKFRSMYQDADQRLKDYKELNQYQETTENHHFISNEESSTIFVGDDFRLTEKEYLSRQKKLQKNSFVKLKNDPRITQVGYFIRKYSIDELPQLFNILKGDMSIVGNRPLPLYEAELLTSDEYIERFMAPAGLTGLWQVEKRGIEGILSPEERKQLDIQYARKFTFGMDMKIIFRTFTAFIQKENV